jgi:hypothetical protein
MDGAHLKSLIDAWTLNTLFLKCNETQLDQGHADIYSTRDPLVADLWNERGVFMSTGAIVPDFVNNAYRRRHEG